MKTLPLTLLLGAGPSGLSVAAHLAKRGLPYRVLERAASSGAVWRGYYDRLHLHTAKRFSHLPFVPFPDSFPEFVSRNQFADYLDAYPRALNLNVSYGQEVKRIERAPNGWHVQTEAEMLDAANVVFATGANRVPHVPTWPGQERFGGPILHSSRYRNGEAYRGKRVLVVGFGNTGAELALDLHEHGAKPSLVVRSPQWISPRGEQSGQAAAIFASKLPNGLQDTLTRWSNRRQVGDLTRYGIPTPDYAPSAGLRQGKVFVIDVGTLPLIKSGDITVLPDVVGFGPEQVAFGDGRERPFDAVILATGYRPFLTTLLGETPGLLNARGIPEGLWSNDLRYRGLYFLGFQTPLEGILHGIARDAGRIARHIAWRGIARRG